MKLRRRNKIRRFVDDVLPLELKNSIRQMTQRISQDVARKVLATEHERNRPPHLNVNKD